MIPADFELSEEQLTRLENAYALTGLDDSPLAKDTKQAVREIRSLRAQVKHLRMGE